MRVEPYLMFAGRCEEALAFYQRAIGAKPQMVLRFKESPEPPPTRIYTSLNIAVC